MNKLVKWGGLIGLSIGAAGCAGDTANSQTAYVSCGGLINIGCGVRQVIMPSVRPDELALFLLALLVVLGGLYVALTLAGAGHNQGQGG